MGFNLQSHSLILLGDSGTGKTKSVQELIGPNFQESLCINSQLSLYNWKLPISLEPDIKKLFKEKEIPPCNQINCTIWDSNGDIQNLSHFCLINHVSTGIIFCNLQNTLSCDRLSFWKEIIDKYRQGIQIIVVGTILVDDKMEVTPLRPVELQLFKLEDDPFKTIEELEAEQKLELERNESKKRVSKINEKLVEKNELKVLQWCVEQGDIPFFKVDLDKSDDIKRMYHSIFIDRIQKILKIS